MTTKRGINMIPLLIIADDFTGALDTGVQFSKQNVVTHVIISEDRDLLNLPEDIQVLVIDTESRHLPPEQAYGIVREIAREAFEIGVKTIYKKIDSALRGNIGAELTALADTLNNTPVFLLPAFPKMMRTTVDGIQYINDVPVSESVFGQDPFEPVTASFLPDIIRQQSDIRVSLLNPGDPLPKQEKKIVVINSITDEELVSAAKMLTPSQPKTLAGCAGFAEYLPEMLQLSRGEIPRINSQERLLVISGSVNPITLRQNQCAADYGFRTMELTPLEKMTPGFFSNLQSRHLSELLQKACESDRLLIAAAMNLESVAASDRFAAKLELSVNNAREVVSQNLGELSAILANNSKDTTFFFIGGDTLNAFLNRLGVKEITPVAELLPGVVLSQVNFEGRKLGVVSKSGGFGSEDIILRVQESLFNSNVNQIV